MIQACHLSIPATSDESHYAPRFQRRLNLTDPAYRIDPTASLHDPHLFPLNRRDANPLIESAGKTEATSLRAAPVRVRSRTVEQQSYADVTSLRGPFNLHANVGSDALGLRSRLLRPV